MDSLPPTQEGSAVSEPELSRSGIVGISRSRTGLYGHSRVSWCWFLFSLDSEVSADHLDDTGILVYRFTIESQQSVRRDLLNSIVVGAVTTSGRVVSADLQARRGAQADAMAKTRSVPYWGTECFRPN